MIHRIGTSTYLADSCTFICGADEVKLTPREAALFAFLLAHKNEIVTRESILDEIWGKSDYFAGRSMDVYIFRLRKHLEQDKAINLHSIRSLGFRLEG